jgi:hypothetical protein
MDDFGVIAAADSFNLIPEYPRKRQTVKGRCPNKTNGRPVRLRCARSRGRQPFGMLQLISFSSMNA